MLCGRRKNNSPTSGEGQSRLKNCPGLTVSALGDAWTTRCLYSELTHSWDTTGHSDSSAGMRAGSVTGLLLPTTKGSEANGSKAMVFTRNLKQPPSRHPIHAPRLY